jgi:hypothetical protein
MAEWLVVQNFYHGLTRRSQEHLDAAAAGAFLSLDVAGAKALVEKIASHQSWMGERQAPHSKGVHQVDSFDMLAAKMDLLMKKLEMAQIADARITCETCGDTGHSGTSCPMTQEDAHFIGSNNSNNSGFRPQQGWNSKPNLPFGQQQDAGSRRKTDTTSGAEQEAEEEEVEEPSSATAEETVEVPRASSDYHDTTILPFLKRRRKPVTDEQFGKFVEVIRKVYVNIPLLDAMQVPTYSKYLKDILGNKRTLPHTEMVQLTEECRAAILNSIPQKKKDPGCPTIACSIGTQTFKRALCDLGASVSVMPKVVFEKLKHVQLVPTAMCLQLADQSVRYPAGIAENIPVKVRDFLIPVDFVILDMEDDTKTSLILGRPFLSTANASIDVGAGEIQFNINGETETFTFSPKVESRQQVNMVETSTPPREPEIPLHPSIEAIAKALELLTLRKQKKLHDRRNAWRRIQRKQVLEKELKEVETKAPPTRKVWREKRGLPDSSLNGNTPRSSEHPVEDGKLKAYPAKDIKPKPSP